ncbi:sensor histidine kinase [Dethiobacter alkaliphilus]|uniref:histidine kinase n=1 Tax=Dethiobacter alkaliphilus AHT 1 TaxID=555088 RepID=C0GF32_DETAL|nr:histidine kinase [Dethiobacter alkaliphilus]EEG78214.1 integral membrane sensor signal transduction histidine kinase [Dethiobacter alkaliphilus AHT 1]
MLRFFIENKIIILVIYTILFFLMALAIILKVNKKSELALARSLWLLAGFALTHGINEFIIFVHNVKAAELTTSVENVLLMVELAFKATSFMFVLWLGICLVTDYFQRFKVLKLIGALLCGCWILVAVYFLGIRGGMAYIPGLDNLSRHMFAFPGFLLSAVGIWLQVREVERFESTSLLVNLKALAVTFFLASFFTGLIGNEPIFWPTTVLNRRSFMEFSGVPVIFFRSVILVFITYFVIRVVHVFQVEREYRLEEMMRQQVLMDERERIGRELHDGIIQSIYSVGLKLEQAKMLVDKRIVESKKQMAASQEELNQVIHDIRDYIQELQPSDLISTSLVEGVKELVAGFREKSMIPVELVIEGSQQKDLNIIQINNVFQVLKELLTNATKHSRATKIKVSLVFKEDRVQIRYGDNGTGFDPGEIEVNNCGERQGLKNVFFRIGMLQGTVNFYAAPGRGTHFEITVPYKKIYYDGANYIDDLDYFIG